MTLPIVLSNDNELYLDLDAANSFGRSLREPYVAANPFPHISLDSFLPLALAERLILLFPNESMAGDSHHNTGYGGLRKRGINPESCSWQLKSIFYFFNSAPFLSFLEGLTGINHLIGDPYFAGGGLHEIYAGGKLGVHADFRINEKLNLKRRINVLIYLNHDWDSEYGGALELWSKNGKKREVSVSPIFNRAVIFNTEADSYHGHPDPLNVPEGRSRRSIALYYYTASEKIHEDTPNHTTHYIARPSDDVAIKREVMGLRIQNYLRDWLPPILYRNLRYLRGRSRP